MRGSSMGTSSRRVRGEGGARRSTCSMSSGPSASRFGLLCQVAAGIVCGGRTRILVSLRSFEPTTMFWPTTGMAAVDSSSVPAAGSGSGSGSRDEQQDRKSISNERQLSQEQDRVREGRHRDLGSGANNEARQLGSQISQRELSNDDRRRRAPAMAGMAPAVVRQRVTRSQSSQEEEHVLMCITISITKVL